MARWLGDANFRLRLRPTLPPPPTPPNYVQQFVVAAWLSSTYPGRKKSSGTWDPVRMTDQRSPLEQLLPFIFHSDSQRSTLNPPTPPPPENCFPPELSLDAAGFFCFVFDLFRFFKEQLWLARNAASRPASAEIPT